MIFDTHAHYDDEQFNEDREIVLKNLKDQNIIAVNVGASFEGSCKALEYANKYDFIYGAVGIHPDNVGELDNEKFEKLTQMARNNQIVAIGEIGLDYHWMVEEKELQKYWFIKQLELARTLAKPINVHSRDAAMDTLSIIKEHGQNLGGIIHCYSYSVEQAIEYLEMGYYIGIGGVVTFKNSKKLKEVVKQIPIDRIVLETDCPYLAPEPNRGKRNSSLNLKYVAAAIGEIKELSEEQVIDITFENAKRVYKLDIGAILILLPMTTSRVVFSICGLVVLLIGIVMLVDRIRKRRLLEPKDDPNIIDAL